VHDTPSSAYGTVQHFSYAPTRQVNFKCLDVVTIRGKKDFIGAINKICGTVIGSMLTEILPISSHITFLNDKFCNHEFKIKLHFLQIKEMNVCRGL
jgi:hypothetical protein